MNIFSHYYINSIIVYAGLIIGYLNTLLFINVLSMSDYGIFQIWLSAILFFSQIPSIGFNAIIMRFSNIFKSKNHDKGFTTFILINFIIILLIFISSYLIFKYYILSFYKNNTLFNNNYYIGLIICALNMILNILDAWIKSINKSYIALFIKYCVLRLGTTIMLFLSWKNYISFNSFAHIYLLIVIISLIIAIITIYKNDKIFINKISLSNYEKIDIIVYGMYYTLSGISYIIINKLSISMLNYYNISPVVIGCYACFAHISNVISISNNVINVIFHPIIVKLWHQNNLNKIKSIYQKTSILQTMVGGLLFIEILINKNNLFNLLISNEYSDYFAIFYIIGLSELINVSFGTINEIISCSVYYRLIIILNVGVAFLCILLYILLIPSIGYIGAGLVHLIVVSIRNIISWFLLKRKYNLQPFTIQHLFIIIIALLSLGIGITLPNTHNTLLDTIIKITLTSSLYIFFMIKFIQSDMMNFLYKSVDINSNKT